MFRYPFKLNYLIGSLFVFHALMGCGDTESKGKDAYIVRVGDSVVTVRDFNRAFEIARADYNHSLMQNPAFFREARLRLLNQMIEEMILMQRAKELAIQISDAELEKATEDIKKDYPEGVFEETLLENAVSYTYWKNRLKTRLLMEKIVAKEFGEQVTLTPEDISAYYQEHLKGHNIESNLKDESQDSNKMVANHLRWKKTEEAYKTWIEGLRQKQIIEINGTLWEKVINS